MYTNNEETLSEKMNQTPTSKETKNKRQISVGKSVYSNPKIKKITIKSNRKIRKLLSKSKSFKSKTKTLGQNFNLGLKSPYNVLEMLAKNLEAEDDQTESESSPEIIEKEANSDFSISLRLPDTKNNTELSMLDTEEDTSISHFIENEETYTEMIRKAQTMRIEDKNEETFTTRNILDEFDLDYSQLRGKEKASYDGEKERSINDIFDLISENTESGEMMNSFNTQGLFDKRTLSDKSNDYETENESQAEHHTEEPQTYEDTQETEYEINKRPSQSSCFEFNPVLNTKSNIIYMMNSPKQKKCNKKSTDLFKCSSKLLKNSCQLLGLNLGASNTKAMKNITKMYFQRMSVYCNKNNISKLDGEEVKKIFVQ